MLSPNRLRLYLRGFEVLAKKKFGWLGKWFFLQPIWVLNRKQVAGGLGLGVTLAFVPLPIQMLLCVPLSIILRVNLPAALGAVWLSNPLTAGPIFFFALRVGQWVTNRTDSWKILTHVQHHRFGQLNGKYLGTVIHWMCDLRFSRWNHHLLTS